MTVSQTGLIDRLRELTDKGELEWKIKEHGINDIPIVWIMRIKGNRFILTTTQLYFNGDVIGGTPTIDLLINTVRRTTKKSIRQVTIENTSQVLDQFEEDNKAPEMEK